MLALLGVVAAIVCSALLAIRRASRIGRRAISPADLRLEPSFQSGVAGGLIGGTIAGILLVAIQYFWMSGESALLMRMEFDSWSTITMQIFAPLVLAAAITGVFLGAAVQFGAQLARRIRQNAAANRLIFNEVIGATVAGTIGGLLPGAYIGSYFGALPLPPVSITVLALSCAVGVVGIVLGALLYDYAGGAGRMFRAVTVAGVVATLLWLPFVAVVGQEVIDHWFLTMSDDGSDRTQYLIGGLLLGGSTGCFIGLQAGLTFLIYRAWSSIQKEGDPDADAARKWGERFKRLMTAVSVFLMMVGAVDGVRGLVEGSGLSRGAVLFALGGALLTLFAKTDITVSKGGITLTARAHGS